jgi:glucose/mannose transport system permease protein
VVYGIPITTLIFRNYYAGIPTKLVEASRIDGANIFGIYRHILFPLSVIGDPQRRPTDYRRAEQPGRQFNRRMERADGAGALIAALPTLAVYIFLGRFFMRGMLAESLKG